MLFALAGAFLSASLALAAPYAVGSKVAPFTAKACSTSVTLVLPDWRSSSALMTCTGSGASVSMPLSWDELEDDELSPHRFTIHTAPPRVAAVYRRKIANGFLGAHRRRQSRGRSERRDVARGAEKID